MNGAWEDEWNSRVMLVLIVKNIFHKLLAFNIILSTQVNKLLGEFQDIILKTYLVN